MIFAEFYVGFGWDTGMNWIRTGKMAMEPGP